MKKTVEKKEDDNMDITGITWLLNDSIGLLNKGDYLIIALNNGKEIRVPYGYSFDETNGRFVDVCNEEGFTVLCINPYNITYLNFFFAENEKIEKSNYWIKNS